MKLFGLNISRGNEVENVTTKVRERVKVSTKIIQKEFTQANQNVGRWRSATLIAKSRTNPNRIQLHEIYNDVVLDGHLSSLMRTIKLRVSDGAFAIKGTDGEIDEALTEKINSEWFSDYCDAFVDSIFWGHSLVQINGIEDDRFVNLETISRDHVIPEFKRVRKHTSDQPSMSIDYTERPFSNWLIEIGKPDDLGLLHKATPLVLWKKAVFGAWSQYSEIFGTPMRVGKTDVLNPDLKNNMEQMLKNMTTSSFAVLDPDDTLEFVTDNKHDAFEVFDKLIERCNSELSKLVLGQTGTTDEKSFVGSAEVHSDILNDYVRAIKHRIEHHFNRVVVPLLTFHRMFPDGISGCWDKSEKVSHDKQFEMTSELLKYYAISPEWIEDKFNIPVEARTIETGTGDSVIPDVENLYNGLIH